VHYIFQEATLPVQLEDEWLSLSEAANMLGMHPATLRLWADRNELPSRRTGGGHRRFRRSDIEAHLHRNQDVERKPRLAAHLLIQSVLGRVRFAFTDGTLNTFPWYQNFNDTAREGYRSLGRRVLELVLHALVDITSESELRIQAVQLGTEYGTLTRRSHVSVADAVRAFLYFRSLVDESVIQLAEVQGIGSSHPQVSRDHQDVPWVESLHQITAITNEILPALIEAALTPEP
jgi:excisionase family DNA binding protein